MNSPVRTTNLAPKPRSLRSLWGIRSAGPTSFSMAAATSVGGFLGDDRALGHDLGHDRLQDIEERRHAGPVGQVDARQAVGDGVAAVADDELIGVAELGDSRQQLGIEQSGSSSCRPLPVAMVETMMSHPAV